LLALPAFAQKLPFRAFTVEDGLSANMVAAISQEVNGTLWVGTGEGLSAFDGTTFQKMSVHDGLGANHITCIVRSKASKEVMWIATLGGGVSKYHDGKFSTFIPKTSPAAAFVYDLVEDSKGDVWCITNDGLYRLTGSTFIREDRICSDPSSLLWSADSLLWIGSRGDLIVYSPYSHSRDSLLLGIGEITTLFQDRLGSVWVATADSMIVKMKIVKATSGSVMLPPALC